MTEGALREQVLTLDELLREHEKITLNQSTLLEELVVELSEQARVLQATLQNIADGVTVYDTTGRIIQTNAAARQVFAVEGVDPREIDWDSSLAFFHPDTITPIVANDMPIARALRGESVDDVEMFVRYRYRAEDIWIQVSARPIRDDDGTLRGAVAAFRDISERKRWERDLEERLARERERNDALERLRSAVQELSTPILELWDDILALPLIGVVDSSRSAQIMERLLAEVSHRQCHFVIIDVTGVEVIDTATADRIIRLVKSVELLGAQCVLTGIQPQVAQTLVAIGVDLAELVTRRNLKHGLRECLRRMAQDKKRPDPMLAPPPARG